MSEPTPADPHTDHGRHGSTTEGAHVAQRSLLAYLDSYAAGGIDREEMLATVSAWPLEERDWDLDHTLPDHQDNTADVIAGAVLNGQLTEEDYREIFRRRR